MSNEGARASIGVSLEREIPDEGTFTIQSRERLRVQIHAERGSLERAVEAVERVGGAVLYSYDTLVLAEVSPADIRTVADRDAVRLVNEYVPPEPSDNPRPYLRHADLPEERDVPDESLADWLAVLNERHGITEADLPEHIEIPDPAENGSGEDGSTRPTTEGREIIGADELQDRGITGDGRTVAVCDVAPFDVENPQYSDQVIATVGAQAGDPAFEDSYRQSGGHGDACTDILSVVAPDADLVLVDTRILPGGLFQALDILEAEFPEVDVVSYSVGFLPDFRIDGLDPISLRIAEFTDNTDAVFVNSAGNSAAVENAVQFIPGIGPVPIPQGFGDAYDSKGNGVFTDDDLLEFDANFAESLEESTRLPVETLVDPTVAAADEDTSRIGWTIVHWDADPVVDDQVYEVRIYATPGADEPLETSRTTNPWETIVVSPEWYEGETTVTMDVEDDAWVVTDVTGEADGDLLRSSGDNPTLGFPEGQRLTIVNEAWDEHPLEFRDGSGGALLSQDPDTEGSLEAPEFSLIDWTQDGAEIAFTVTGALSELATYVSTADTDLTGQAAATQALPIYVEVERIAADEPHHFDVWGQFGDINIPTPWATDERSIGIPATSQDDNLLSIAAVQAVDVGDGEGETQIAFDANKGDLAGYSSQGPTQDGRQGIDLAGPSHVSTAARGPVEAVFGFNGTSAAAPHVAGAVTLLSQAAAETLVEQQTTSTSLAPGQDDQVAATVDDEELPSPGEYVVRALTDDDLLQGTLTVE